MAATSTTPSARSRSTRPEHNGARPHPNGATQPVRVLHLIDALEIGGAERTLAEIVMGLDRARYRPRVLCLVKRGPIADQLRQSGVPVDCFEIDLGHRVREIRRLAEWCRRHEIKILHTHGYSAGVLGRLAGLVARVPVIIAHLHTTDWGYQPRQRWIERALAMVTDRVVCCSHAVARFANDALNIPPGKCSVIYNGVATQRLAAVRPADGAAVRRLYGLPADEPLIGIIGSLTPHKGHDVALQAFVRLRQNRPRARLMIVGDGPERAGLQKLAKKLEIAPAVIFVGQQPEIAPYIAACDLICQPSTGREGLGLALLEAMAMGKPVVASNLGGIPEVVASDETGLLVEPGDVEQLADVMASLLADDASSAERLKQMGRRAQERARHRFDAAVMTRRIEELYEELGERATPPSRRRPTVLYTTCRGTLAGGGQQSLLQLLTHLDRSRFRPVVLCPQRGTLSERLEEAGIEAVIEPFPHASFRTAVPTLRAIIRLIRLMWTRRARLIHTDAPRETLYAGLAATLYRIPVLWHIRASNGEWADRWLVGLSSRLVLVADALRTRFRMSVPTDQGNKLVVIHNGVELESSDASPKLRPQLVKELGCGSGALLMAAAGRVEVLKGADILVAALGRLPRGSRAGQTDWRLLFLGAVEPDYHDRLLAQAEALGVADRIAFMGHQTPITPWLEAIDLLVHPSIFEAFPRVILEAMAASRPVVATNVGGVAEAVADGETGLLVPAGDPVALADAIGQMMRDPAAREVMGRAGRQRVERSFRADDHARRVEELYGELLGVAR